MSPMLSRVGDERRERLRRVRLDVLADARAAEADAAVLSVFGDTSGGIRR